MIFETIVELIANQIDCKPEDVKMETTFESLGIDSLDTVEMVMELEEKLGFELELDKKVVTVGDLVEFAEEKSKGR
ncbi:acyl carrier protein [Parasporobacterium paucivorans]|uniref:Acyl carrier protein n=1 Tax=Parasporobacterium paucivorans DSM 15970 TaxID=1122934 RepID=A0A1M6KBS9_9FIRM|nr:acyl carrier protein [Parasporobacterium paucivorans]SHJ56329.1 acyl carrier protein [Parasporobacterium paucivorans DSM 15970]